MKRKALVIGAVTVLAEAVAVAARRGRIFQVDTVVRCRAGHLFTTYWIPGASCKALRFGWWRGQRCPVGHHWSIVTPVRMASLTDEERRTASSVHDWRVP